MDLEALRARMAETIEKARGEDPKELRRRVTALEKELAAARAEKSKPERVVETVEVAVLDEKQAVRLEETLRAMQDVGAKLVDVAQDVLDALFKARSGSAAVAAPIPRPLAGIAPVPSPVARDDGPPAREGQEPGLSVGARGLLIVLVRRHPMRLTRSQLATLARRSIRSSSFGPQVRELLNAGLAIEHDGQISATEAGRAALGAEARVPQTSEEVIDAWRQSLPGGAARMLDVLVEAHPATLDRDDLARAAGMSPTSSGVGQHLGTLRRNGLAEVNGREVRASDSLFLGGRVTG